MRPTPEVLADPELYVLREEIGHDNLVPAVQAHLRSPGPIKTAYILINVAVLAAIGLIWWRTATPIFPALTSLLGGMGGGYLLLLPVHEWVHALAYRRLGAEKTGVVYNLRNLTAYCVADRFVVTGREFVVVCLAPFVVINTILLAILALVGGFSPVLWGALLLHVGGCSGDFAFVNYVWQHRGEGLFTFDDVAGKRSCFYSIRR